MPPKKTPMSDAAIKELIAQGVVDALADYEANRSSGNGHDNHNSGSGDGRTPYTARVCTYKDFLNCQPLNFKGTEGVVGLTQWFEKMESVFYIRNCTVECQIKVLMFPEESNKVEKYVGGLPDMIQGNVMSARPKTMQEAIELPNDLMDQKVRTFAKRQAKNKRKLDNNPRDKQVQQPPFKRQNVAKAYTARPGEKKEYVGTLPLCTKCNYHHNGSCAAKCTNYKRVGHLARDCRRHYKKDCPKLKNKNHGNQSANCEAHGRAYGLGADNENPDSNVVTGTFLLNNCYASVLFDTDADRSFVSTTFSSLIDIIPSTLDNYYDVKLADGKIIRVNTIIRGCTLNLLNHLFNIDLMPVALGSFDVIIGMDWLSLYHTVIVCDEKIVRVPFGNETLIIRGDGSNPGNESQLNIISCTKTQKYLLKGCHVFLAQITEKKTKDKSNEKRLEDVQIVRDFP
ncbi:putative reverse transcriptase domain-containing protein [Tanacetum coccineum]|uniref:Reverse transcriptase domain-containing protein n=1 Tax=Tanacetum coccineum TaxID=301880 RepID=A0ABQ5AMF3_9ASTR